MEGITANMFAELNVLAENLLNKQVGAVSGYHLSWSSHGGVWNQASMAGTVQTLTEMREAIRSKGWVKGMLFTNDGMCMLGAYMYGSGYQKDRESPEARLVADLLEEVIRLEWGILQFPAVYHRWNIVVHFNDSSLVKLPDVLNVIDKAIWLAQQRKDVLVLPAPAPVDELVFDPTQLIIEPFEVPELAAV